MKKEEIEQIVNDVLTDESVEIVEVVVRGSSKSQVIQVFVCRDGGITLDDCVRLSRKLAHRLESEEEALGLVNAYRLEVSSPGMDRSLKNRRDFERNLQRKVKVSFVEDGRSKTIEGRIEGVDEEAVAIALKKEPIRISYTAIERALVQIEWNS